MKTATATSWYKAAVPLTMKEIAQNVSLVMFLTQIMNAKYFLIIASLLTLMESVLNVKMATILMTWSNVNCYLKIVLKLMKWAFVFSVDQDSN